MSSISRKLPNLALALGKGELSASKKVEYLEGKLAREKSEGPFAESGGDMGYVVQGQLLDEMDQTIFSMKKGETSDVVETQVGYHIFLVEDIQEPRPYELAEVNDFLKDQLHRKKFQENLIEWLEEKRKNAYISYK